ncbi:hypothetical protein SDC9_83771 [bioreactor metagenome]|uniref:Uncharacterized protein n=1 Tax=bioreactor metagenome TaxID=1076179 RepID=A0A644Z8E8_9ZZZZ
MQLVNDADRRARIARLCAGNFVRRGNLNLPVLNQSRTERKELNDSAVDEFLRGNLRFVDDGKASVRIDHQVLRVVALADRIAVKNAVLNNVAGLVRAVVVAVDCENRIVLSCHCAGRLGNVAAERILRQSRFQAACARKLHIRNIYGRIGNANRRNHDAHSVAGVAAARHHRLAAHLRCRRRG